LSLKFSKSHLSYLSPYRCRWSFAHLQAPLALSRFCKKPPPHKKKTSGGVSEEDRTKSFVPQIYCHHQWHQHLSLVSCAQRMGVWIGVFGGGRKEMLSLPNEGRFTQYNEGWIHGFTADVYLKRLGKYCFGTEGFICRYTYPLQPLAPT